jgi:hypothetical protein
MVVPVCFAGDPEATGQYQSMSKPTFSSFYARPGDPVTVSGTLMFFSENEGCWTLRIDGGAAMQLAGLPLEFQQDGLRVSATVHVEAERVGDCWPGLLLFVDSIRVQSELNEPG